MLFRSDYKKIWDTIPVSNAVNQLVGTGGAGPSGTAGVNLPNEDLYKQKYGTKSIIVANITQSAREIFSDIGMNEFLEYKHEINKAKKSIAIRGPIMVTLHEIVGHGSGKIITKEDPHITLREFYSTLEEARAELCALHHIWDLEMQKIGVVPDNDCCESAYLGYALSDLTLLRMLENEDEIHEDHLRATHLIVQYLMHEKKCIEFYKSRDPQKAGKTFVRVTDYQLMREGVAELRFGAGALNRYSTICV